MSAYREIKTQFKNIESLKKALADVGLSKFDLSANVRENTLDLQGYGRYGTSTKVAVRIPKASMNAFEDTGFEYDKATGTYTAHISTHDGFHRNPAGSILYGNFGEGTLQKVTQRYAYHEAVRLAKLQGYTVRELKSTDGTIRLQLTHI